MKKKILIITFIPLVILVTCSFLFLLLPFIADHYFLPKVIRNLPLAEKEMSLSRISPWKVRGTFSSTENEKNGITVPKFEIHYSPMDLLRGKISLIVIDSASVYLDRKDGKLLVRSLEARRRAERGKKIITTPFLPLYVQKIVLKNSTLVVQESESVQHYLNIDGYLLPHFERFKNGQYAMSNVEGKVWTSGAFSSVIRVDTEKSGNGHKVLLDIQIADIARVLKYIPGLAGMVQRSSTDTASISGVIQTEGINSIQNYSGSVKIDNFRFAQKGVLLQNSRASEPLLIQLTGTPHKMEMLISELELSLPEKYTFNFNAEYNIEKKLFSGGSTIIPGRTNAPVTVDFWGNTTPSKTDINYTIKGEAFILGDNLDISELTARGKAEISGNVVSGKLTGKVPKIELKKRKIALIGVSFDLPLHYPAPASDVVIPGNILIDEIHYKQRNSAKLSASIGVSAENAQLNTLLTSPLNSQFRLQCRGSANLKRNVSLKCMLPEVHIDSSELTPAISLPEKLAVAGKVAAEAHFTLAGSSISGDAEVKYRGGKVDYGEYTLSNISADLAFPNLPDIKSSPSQSVTIGTLDLGKIKMSDAKIRFRVDDSESIFIEGAQLSWCGGRVETGGLKLFKQMKELSTTLYCDRLGYTDLLNQLGIGDAEGEGSLNGRLPLYIDGEGVQFDDGFLFSTPGKSGIVRFRNTDQLRQGMPTLNQAAYLDYSLEALENFHYNWTKLTFSTEQEQLLLSLQLDGKPAEALPYGYKQGQIIKTKQGPGLQHPIRLDVNFRLPLNDLFRYGKNIQSIMENM